ncbi:MAG TPA: hypothetical protein VFQ85_12365 [Mycobacteriales bacterium]|jgi:hypothetical protein|nr:hypothetical protein [Mycobacteriales bacterium]
MSYVAIDPAAVSALATTLDAAADSVDAARLAVERTLRSVGASSPAPARLGAVSAACRGSSADLRRRVREVARLQVLMRHTGETAPPYPRPDTVYATFEEAEAAGEALAARFTALADGTAWYDSKRVLPVLAELARHRTDTHFCAAFFRSMYPPLALLWVRQISELARWHDDFPAREEALAAYLTALSTGLNADPVLLRTYLTPMRGSGRAGVLLPGEIRDVLRYGSYDDATVLTLVRSAVDLRLRGVRAIEPWEDDPGLFDRLLGDPDLARRFVDDLPDDTVRELLGTEEGLLSGFGAVVAAAGPSSLPLTERLVALLAADGQHLAPEVQEGLATALGAHLDILGGNVADGLYPGRETTQDDLVRVFERVMSGNDAAFATLHAAGAETVAALLSGEAALRPASAEVAAVGGIFALLARADSGDAIDRADATAGWWAMAAQGVGLIPLPGPALAGTVVKKTFGALLAEQADNVRARGDAAAESFVDDTYHQGRMLLGAALWRYDQAAHPDAASALAPPKALLGSDGTLKVHAELDTVAEKRAYERWLATPLPASCADLGLEARTLREAVNALSPGYANVFDTLFRRPVK